MRSDQPKKQVDWKRIQAELETIRTKCGGFIRPEEVVRFARNTKTELHCQFDWDDSEAAEKWRIEQARRVIRVIVWKPDESSKDVFRVYVSIPSDQEEGNGYRTMHDVLSNENMTEQLLAAARRDFETYKMKYSRLKRLAEGFAVMESALKDTTRRGGTRHRGKRLGVTRPDVA